MPIQTHRLEQQIKRLSDAERQAILNESPFEFGWFQGDGYHIFLKNEPDFTKAYVDSLEEIYQQDAENWIIQPYLIIHGNSIRI